MKAGHPMMGPLFAGFDEAVALFGPANPHTT